MNLKSVILLLCIAAAIAFRAPSAQTGQDQSVVWTPQGSHVLQTENQLPRSVQNKISFKQAFQAFPQVLVTNWLLDWQDNAVAGYSIEVTAISQTDFTLKYNALTQRQVYSIFINYVAIDDPAVQVGYVYSESLGPLAAGTGERKTTLQLKFPDWADEVPQKVVGTAFLIGARWQRINFVVFTNLRDVTPQTANLDVWTTGQSSVDFVRVSYIVGDARYLGVSSTGKGAANSASSVNIPQPFSVDKASIWGISGYDAEGSINLRLKVEGFQFPENSGQASANIGTWANSKVYDLQWRAVAYKPDPNRVLWASTCAELFSECNYKGKSVIMCDKVNSFPREGWSGSVRSFHLPEGGTLRLYNNEDQKGKVVTFTESQTCVDNYTFSLLQKQQKNQKRNQ